MSMDSLINGLIVTFLCCHGVQLITDSFTFNPSVRLWASFCQFSEKKTNSCCDSQSEGETSNSCRQTEGRFLTDELKGEVTPWCSTTKLLMDVTPQVIRDERQDRKHVSDQQIHPVTCRPIIITILRTDLTSGDVFTFWVIIPGNCEQKKYIQYTYCVCVYIYIYICNMIYTIYTSNEWHELKSRKSEFILSAPLNSL